jgi:hypothetical protein
MRLMGLYLFALLVGCHREPTGEVRSETNDLSPGVAPKLASISAAQQRVDAGNVDARNKASEVAKTAAPECRVASDCEAVPVECCDCKSGGSQQALPKAKAEALKKSLPARCKDVMCTMMFSTDPTCGKRPDCVDGACVMVAKGGTSPSKSAPSKPRKSK